MTAPEFLWGTGFKGVSHSERVSSPIWSTCLFVRFKVRRLPHLNFLCGSILAPQKTGNPNIAHFLLNTFGLVQIRRAIIRAMRIGVSMYSYVQSVKNSGMTIPGFIHEAKRAGAEGHQIGHGDGHGEAGGAGGGRGDRPAAVHWTPFCAL